MFNYILKNKYHSKAFYIDVGMIIYTAVATPTTLTILKFGMINLAELGL
jgi:hypothetical protein